MRRMILAIASIGMAFLFGAAPGLAGEAGLRLWAIGTAAPTALTGNAPPIITAVTTRL